jgi:MATE family multidrug resistance protein
MLIFVCLPQPLIKLFRPDDMPLENLPHMIHLGSILLRFVACYVLFDAFYMIIVGVLKGAGDTRFIMWSMGILSIFGMLLPVYIGVAYFGGGIYFIWSWATFYVFLLAAVSFWRYRQGTWKKMRVIEQHSGG